MKSGRNSSAKDELIWYLNEIFNVLRQKFIIENNNTTKAAAGCWTE